MIFKVDLHGSLMGWSWKHFYDTQNDVFIAHPRIEMKGTSSPGLALITHSSGTPVVHFRGHSSQHLEVPVDDTCDCVLSQPCAPIKMVMDAAARRIDPDPGTPVSGLGYATSCRSPAQSHPLPGGHSQGTLFFTLVCARNRLQVAITTSCRRSACVLIVDLASPLRPCAQDSSAHPGQPLQPVELECVCTQQQLLPNTAGGDGNLPTSVAPTGDG